MEKSEQPGKMDYIFRLFSSWPKIIGDETLALGESLDVVIEYIISTENTWIYSVDSITTICSSIIKSGRTDEARIYNLVVFNLYIYSNYDINHFEVFTSQKHFSLKIQVLQLFGSAQLSSTPWSRCCLVINTTGCRVHCKT